MVTDRKAGSTPPRGRARRFFRGVLFGFLLVVVAALATLAGFYVAVDRSLPPLQLTSAKGTSQSTRIYTDGDSPQLLAELHGTENRQILSGDQIPQVMRDAVVAIEDERFYEHKGVDFLGILRATWANIRHREIVQGASTITEQYINNAFITDDRTLDKKLREAALAYQLEKQWSKEKILNEYLNIIYFGEGAYGIEAAAEEYYGVHASQLDVAQAAMLAALPKGPSIYSPRRDADKAKTRRDLVLNKMYQQKYITSDQLQEALAAPLGIVESSQRDTDKLPYWVEMVREQLVAHYGSSTVLSGGLRVYVSVDTDLQAQAEKAIANVLDKPGDPSAALVSIDVHTGRLLAMVGGSDFNKMQFNLATQGKRQPGSAFKPFVLVTALQQGISPDALYDSAPYSVKLPSSEWKVDSEDDGQITLAAATAASSNGVYARLIMDLGAEKVAQTAYDMGIQTSLGENPNPSIALGGLTTGVSPLEMAMAYATLATGGERLGSSVTFDPEEPSFPVDIVKVTDAKDQVLDQNEVVKTRVLDAGLAAMTTQVLEGVISDGTGTAADIGRPAAGKTGTTQNYRDAWFVGYTPDIVTAVWVGYPTEQKAMTDVHGIKVTGGSLPAQIWAAYMKAAVKGTKATDFAQPSSDGWVKVKVCSESHLLPTEYCPDTVEALFAKGKEPTETCTIHVAQEVALPDVTGMVVAEAKTLLEQAHFKVSTTDDATAAEPAGTVVSEHPSAGTKVLQGTTIDLVVSARPAGPQQVRVPLLEGLDVTDAEAALADLGLQAEIRQKNDDSPPGTVLSQDVDADTLVDVGTTVRITVSRARETTTTTTTLEPTRPSKGRGATTTTTGGGL